MNARTTFSGEASVAGSGGEIPGPLCAGDRLPSISLPRVVGGERVGWRRQGRDSVVLVLLSNGRAEAATQYINSLAEAWDGFELWNARVLVVAPPSIADAAAREPGVRSLPVLLDAGDELRTRCRVPAGESAVFVADRYGEIFHAAAAGSANDLPDAAKLQDWLKYLATQCAECGVPDEPGYGEWA